MNPVGEIGGGRVPAMVVTTAASPVGANRRIREWETARRIRRQGSWVKANPEWLLR
jgi:hypothetical protein